MTKPSSPMIVSAEEPKDTMGGSRQNFIAAVVVAVIVGLGAWPFFISHALLVNPTAPPPGGQTAKPLNASAAAQQKLGSLIIGKSELGSVCDLNNPVNQTGCVGLCLNAPNPTNPADPNDPVYNNHAYCIKDWRDLSSAATGSFVKLIIDISTDAQLGYVRMKGATAVANPYTFRLGSSFIGGTSALFADGLQIDNYAGYFFGRVAINQGPSNPGRLCLNRTKNYSDATVEEKSTGKYCISQWTEVPAASTADKLTLQAPRVCSNDSNRSCSADSGCVAPGICTGTAATVTESGSVNLAKAFNAGSITLGDPTSLPISLTCGDGMCNGLENNVATSPNYCPIDCAAVSQLTSFTAVPGTDQVSLTFRTADQSPAGPVNVLVVRSDSPNFTFAPADGLTYAVGGMSSFVVVHAETHDQNTLSSIIDTGYGLTANITYYYRAYQGNPYPRYSTALTASATPTGTVVDDGDGGDKDPIIPLR